MTDGERLIKIESELQAIKERNARVEADKAWETSFARTGSICVITYIVAAAVMFLLGSDRFWLNALIPTIGFYLSSQSLPALKRRWIEARLRDPNQK